MEKNYFITDKEDIFFWFSIIEKTEAKKILDIGLFLERIGAIARQVGDIMIPGHVSLDGFNLSLEPPLAIYETIYDQVFATPDEINDHYDLALLLDPVEGWNLDAVKRMIICQRVSMLAIDIPAYDHLNSMNIDLSKVRDVRTDDREYKLISF